MIRERPEAVAEANLVRSEPSELPTANPDGSRHKTQTEGSPEGSPPKLKKRNGRTPCPLIAADLEANGGRLLPAVEAYKMTVAMSPAVRRDVYVTQWQNARGRFKRTHRRRRTTATFATHEIRWRRPRRCGRSAGSRKTKPRRVLLSSSEARRPHCAA